MAATVEAIEANVNGFTLDTIATVANVAVAHIRAWGGVNARAVAVADVCLVLAWVDGHAAVFAVASIALVAGARVLTSLLATAHGLFVAVIAQLKLTLVS